MRAALPWLHRWRPRSVVALVLTGFTLVMLPLAAGLLVASHLIDRLRVESELTVSQAVVTTRQTHRLMEALDSLERAARQFHVLQDEEARGSFLGTAAAFWQRAEDLATQTENEQIRTRITELAAGGEAIRRTIMQLTPGAGWPIQLTREFTQLRDATREILELSQQQVALDLAHMRERAREARRGLLVQFLLMALLAAALALLFTVLITRPIQRLNRGIRALADPDAPFPQAVGGPQDLEALAERLQWVRDRLQQGEQARSQWLRQVSHELKTPLSALREGISQLRDGLPGALTARQHEMVEILEASSLDLQTRIEQLLHYQRVHERGQPARVQHMRLRPLIEETLARHALICNTRGLTTAIDISEHISVDADREMLLTIFDNLLSNAVKYATNCGAIRIHARSDQQGTHIRVTDDGPGVREHEKSRVFEPFFRGSAPAGGQLPGSGLGLAISRDLARAQGGELRLIKDNAGKTTFELFLPAAL